MSQRRTKLIRKLSIEQFRKFSKFECDLQKFSLIVGPNNSGKSTLLQALSTFAEFGEIWLASNPEIRSQDHLDTHPIELDIAEFRSVALNIFDELWNNQDTKKQITLRAVSEDWDIGFYLQYVNNSSATLGLMDDVTEKSLNKYAKNPLKALYVPSLSGLDTKEPKYGEYVVDTRLAHGKGGSVLRNMVQTVSNDESKWQVLQNTIKTLFGYELSVPSGADPIFARYRHSNDDSWYDLLNGASGFLQTVYIQSALLLADHLILIDEPDAHLHALLKHEIYQIIRRQYNETSYQSMVATHSGRLIEEASNEKDSTLYLITKRGLKPVSRQDANELNKLPKEQIVLAETKQCILYLEGNTDMRILIAWAEVLNHPAVHCLRGAFCLTTAQQKNKKSYAINHFRTLKGLVPSLQGLAISDRNSGSNKAWENIKQGSLLTEEKTKGALTGFIKAFWSRYEIENYLLHPAGLLRFVSKEVGQEGEDNADEYIKNNFAPKIIKQPFEKSSMDSNKGKKEIEKVLSAAKIPMNPSDYYKIAESMTPEEIHPDVKSMLDIIQRQMTPKDMEH